MGSVKYIDNLTPELINMKQASYQLDRDVLTDVLCNIVSPIASSQEMKTFWYASVVYGYVYRLKYIHTHTYVRTYVPKFPFNTIFGNYKRDLHFCRCNDD
jgi:hypothetical protein